MRKLLSLVVTAVLLAVLVVFALANRQTVELSLWPFTTVETRLFLVALGMLGLGLLVGALLMCAPLLHWRLRARSLERRTVELEAALAESRTIVAQLREPAPAGAALAPPRG
jgi:uncharacterized integral membrane protein